MVLVGWMIAQVALATTPRGPGEVDAGARELPPHTPPSAEIVNGDRATADVYPMTGGLLFSGTITAPSLFGGPPTTQELKQFACSSTLIAPDVVLLAAHCVDPNVLSQGGTAEDLKFRWSRALDLREPSSPGDPWPEDSVAVAQTVLPEEWEITALQDFSLGTKKWDIAMLFLEEPVFDVEPAVLITEEEAEQIAEGAAVDVVGWGLTVPLGILDSFAPPDPETVGRKQWGTSTLAAVGDYEMQIGATPDATRKCRGDSGGPTFLEVEADTASTTRLIGVTSRSADFTLCAEKGGFDTRVDAYLGWIDRQLRAGCEDGARSWCDEEGIVPPALAEEAGCGGCDARGSVGGWWGLLGLGLLRRRR
jgi:hypothetical protein